MGTGIFVKQDAEWKTVQVPDVKVGDVWRPTQSAWVRAEDQWHCVWQRTAQIITLPRRTRVSYKEIQDVRTCAA